MIKFISSVLIIMGMLFAITVMVWFPISVGLDVVDSLKAVMFGG